MSAKETMNKALKYAALGGLCAVMLTAGMRYDSIKRDIKGRIDYCSQQTAAAILENFPTPEQAGKAYIILKAAEIRAGRQGTADSIEKTLCGIIDSSPAYSCGYEQSRQEAAPKEEKKAEHQEPSKAEERQPSKSTYALPPATPLLPLPEPAATPSIFQDKKEQEPLYDSEGKDLCVKELESLLKTLEKEGRKE